MKKLHSIHQSSETHWVGNGFPVRSVFSYDRSGKQLDPFLLLDYAAPYEFEPGEGRRGVGAHPHRGFETVTIVFQGEVEHRDSAGGGGKIGPGDVQWMTAAGGLLHEEFHSEEFTRNGGTFEVAQLWVNLPARFKNERPRYQTLLKESIPTISLPDEAGQARIVAGTFGETHGAADTFTPINLWDVRLEPGKFARLPLPNGHTASFLVIRGNVVIDGGKAAATGDLAVFERDGNALLLQATEPTHLLIMSGEPLEEPIAGHGPFVMNTEAELLAAYQDVRSGKMGTLI